MWIFFAIIFIIILLDNFDKIKTGGNIQHLSNKSNRSEIDQSHKFNIKKLNVRDSRMIKEGWFLAYYIPGQRTSSNIKIWEFKEGKRNAIQFWADKSIQNLQTINIKFDFIVRILASSELIANESHPLSIMSSHIAKNLNIQYIPMILQKTEITKTMHKLNSVREREREIANKYVINENINFDLSNKNVLIIDDIFTSGTTSQEVAKTFKNRWNSVNCYLLCLGKTYRPKQNYKY